MRSARVTLSLLAALAWLVSTWHPAAAADKRTLRVFAAASLTGAFGELAKQFEHRHAGVHVELNFAGSQQLAAQMEQGARADVFASADERWMNYARDHDWLAAAPVTFVRNRLVVIVPKTN